MKSIWRSKLSNSTHSGPHQRIDRRQGTSPTPHEPVAIIGMACRFPGSKDLSGFWRQLVAGENAVVEGPPGAVIGRTGRQFPHYAARNEAIRFGAYVEDLDLFDAEFFRISPIEAQ
ncbi:MAG: beta-ketoacyl synthase N-terminal-like domain-containing protein, partial [Gemmatimonadetes bacterium]|nr:beta-ketoacyl synthase N-terminal-like domain-containing protein [Candidatus Palauibacter australiensis]